MLLICLVDLGPYSAKMTAQTYFLLGVYITPSNMKRNVLALPEKQGKRSPPLKDYPFLSVVAICEIIPMYITVFQIPSNNPCPCSHRGIDSKTTRSRGILLDSLQYYN
jgi:hypothetical protein